MKLRGIDFGPVWTASGTLGFYGEGYPYQHLLYKTLGWCDFRGVTLVAKTVTLEPRKGNMRLNKDGSLPLWPLVPACIVVRPRHMAALNAVGLSNCGAAAHIGDGRWQDMEKPYALSFMSVAETREERMNELRKFVELVLTHLLPSLRVPICLQLNYSCPNTGHAVAELAQEVAEALSIAASLNIPLMPKFNILLPVEVVQRISEHPACDAICVSNTIPWGALPEQIDWKKIFGTDKSPLAHLGGGGLSGKPVFWPLWRWLVHLMQEGGITKKIHAGGGILEPRGVYELSQVHVDSVFLGSVSFLRPDQVRPIIDYAHLVYGYQPVERGK
ncbi:MAG: hypothetical protein AAB581_01280 [Patescibacteria group bacterium]